MIRPFATVLFATLVLAGCDLAPPYAAPLVATPEAFKEGAGWSAAKPGDEAPRGAWWSVFGSPELDALEAKVTTSNQDLKAAGARFDEARALARQAQSAIFPTLDAAGAGAARRTSQDIGNPLPRSRYDDYALQLDLNYELDVWGKVRNQALAGGRRAEASAADLATVDLSLHAELAIDYFTLRGADAQQAILDQTVAAYAKALDLTQARFKGGYAAEPDVSSAQALLELAKTQAAETRLNRARLEHAIAVLVGEPASGFALAPVPLDLTPTPVAAALPGALLQRRPDIAAAERRVAAANADIGAARAAFYPDFSLTAALGTQAASAGRLFASPAQTWAIGPSGVLNLFDGGRRHAIDAQTRAAYEEAAADYRQTVLRAYGQVEDNLAALRLLADEADSQALAVQAAAAARAQAERRYNGGYAAYYEVITAQNMELSARLQQAQIQARRMTAEVSLIKALGGGWKAL